jgi:predicted lipid-binding transport protein (Tim44 family)
MLSVMDPLNLLLLAVAAVVIWFLWSVLGTRTGLEKPSVIVMPSPELPQAKAKDESEQPIEADIKSSQPIWQGYAVEGSSLAAGLSAIAGRAPNFTVSEFINGASAAYEMILEAYASGNKTALKPLLSKELYDSFASAIDVRKTNGQSMTFQFVGVKSAKPSEAQLVGNKAEIEVAFAAEMISATLDTAGAVIDGDDKSIRTVTDTWSFERDVTARDPNWKLISTQDHD